MTKVELNLTENAASEIDRLKQATGIESDAQFLATALNLERIVFDAMAKGRQIVLMKDGHITDRIELVKC